MKNKIIILMLCLFPFSVFSQLEKVIVEKYYISDANDESDTTGGHLKAGSTTYRIYVDLAKGSKLTKIYGDVNHALKFASTDTFFNNISDGQTFGKDFPKNRYSENTVALDSWITLGQTTRNSTRTYFGVLKEQDDDGSFIGGVNNDGGSAVIANGLINNADPNAGIPVTTNDGMDTIDIAYLPTSWGDYGFKDPVFLTDSTIFGSVIPGNYFASNDAGLQNSGVVGVNPDSNQILIAQLTTAGVLSFEINIEIVNSVDSIVKYVANDSVLLLNETYNRYLSYPYTAVCGCPDAHYIDYLEDRDCDDLNLCQTLVVFGCLDSTACNYNPDANFNISELCCYPGFCNDRNIAEVCPGSSSNRTIEIESLFPNPANEKLGIKVSNHSEALNLIIYNAYGIVVYNEVVAADILERQIDLDKLENGIFIIHLSDSSSSVSKTFLKN